MSIRIVHLDREFKFAIFLAEVDEKVDSNIWVLKDPLIIEETEISKDERNLLLENSEDECVEHNVQYDVYPFVTHSKDRSISLDSKRVLFYYEASNDMAEQYRAYVLNHFEEIKD